MGDDGRRVRCERETCNSVETHTCRTCRPHELDVITGGERYLICESDDLGVTVGFDGEGPRRIVDIRTVLGQPEIRHR